MLYCLVHGLIFSRIFQVKLLKDILEAWKKEVEKKPPTMSLEDAYQVLNIPHGLEMDEAKVRKAYFRLAQKYHPDKNPDGRVSSTLYGENPL